MARESEEGKNASFLCLKRRFLGMKREKEKLKEKADVFGFWECLVGGEVQESGRESCRKSF